MNVETNIKHKLDELRDNYARALPEKAGEIEQTADAFLSAKRKSRALEECETLQQLCHKISGTAATYGFSDISAHCRDLEDICACLLNDKAMPDGDGREAIRTLVEKIGTSAADAQDVSAREETAPADKKDAERPIFILRKENDGLGVLAGELENHGFGVSMSDNEDNFIELIKESNPLATLLSTGMTDWRNICRTIMRHAGAGQDEEPIVICCGEDDNFAVRLTALRAGAADFHALPASADDILDSIETIRRRLKEDPYRILVVQQDDSIAKQCGNAIRGPAFRSKISRKPSRVLEDIETFRPDLLVCDSLMKHCSGFELARIVWQMPQSRDLEVLFLSPNEHFTKEVGALGLTQDYFIKRPLNSAHLRERIIELVIAKRAGSARSAFKTLRASVQNPHVLGDLHELLGWRATTAALNTVAEQAINNPTPKVLIVEDDIFLSKGIATNLKGYGLEVFQAKSGEQGYDLAWKELPDVIVSDYMMPNGSGEFLLSKLKSTEATKDIPVIILTGRTVNGKKDTGLERQLCGRYGAVSYMTKPIQWDSLVEELRSHIRFPNEPKAGRKDAAA